MGKYAVTYYNEEKNITMELSGFFTDNDAANFARDFLKMSSKVDVKNTYLVLECGRLYLYPHDLKTDLKDVFNMYKDVGYKLVRIKLFKPQKELARKAKELANEIGLTLEIMFVE